jgi:hypothetical protein
MCGKSTNIDHLAQNILFSRILPKTSSSSAKLYFLSHSLPQKILPDLSISFHFFGFRDNIFIFFLHSEVVSLTSNLQPHGPCLCIYLVC